MRLSPAKYVAEKKNAPGGDAATSLPTEGAPMPTPVKEDMMTNHTPTRPWLDAKTAEILTDEDLARLDEQAARWAADPYAEQFFRGDLNDYLADEARVAAKVRQFVGRDEIPMPDFVKLPNRKAIWELAVPATDAVRYLDAEHVDVGKLNARLEADQHALSGRVDTRVSISDCETSDPAELITWAIGLLSLAGRWSEIKEGQA